MKKPEIHLGGMKPDLYLIGDIMVMNGHDKRYIRKKHHDQSKFIAWQKKRFGRALYNSEIKLIMGA